jgi:hypothetical protein
MPSTVQIHAYRSGIFQKFKVSTKDEENTRKRLVAEGYVICQVEGPRRFEESSEPSRRKGPTFYPISPVSS